jgi:hypothetical protein
MSTVIQHNPALAAHHYTARALLSAVQVSYTLPAARISLTARASSAQEALLIANEVAQGFVAYRQLQAQQYLDALRKQLQTEDQALHQQLRWEEQGKARSSSGLPLSMPSLPTIPELQNEVNALQAQLSALPPTVNGDVFVVQLATMKDVVLA